MIEFLLASGNIAVAVRVYLPELSSVVPGSRLLPFLSFQVQVIPLGK